MTTPPFPQERASPSPLSTAPADQSSNTPQISDRHDSERTIARHPSQKRNQSQAQSDHASGAEKHENEGVVNRGKRKAPWGVKWRSSSWFITTVVTLGVTTDILTYTIVVPVLPYRLQALNYSNISALTSWLLFAYSIGIFLCTLPVAYFFHKYPYRRSPLIVAVLVLEVAVVLFMTINAYWVMVLSRFIQGASSTVVWSGKYIPSCENVPEKNVGRQIGFAYSGVSIGLTIAPPIGGALYAKMGWHAPFVFCIIVCAVDLILRLFVIEQKDLRAWEKANADILNTPQVEKKDVRQAEIPAEQLNDPADASPHPSSAEDTDTPRERQSVVTEEDKDEEPVVELSPWKVIVTIASSGRGMTGFWITFVYGLIIGLFEPSLTLRIQSVWHKEADFVGLVYLAAAAPTFVSGPIIGALADKYGAEFIMLPCMIFALPWLPLMILKKSLGGFIVLFALAEVALQCASGPAGLEVTLVSRMTPGISEIHQFAAMNIAFAVSTSIGAVIGGQIYDHLPNGWVAICWFAFGITAVSLPLPFIFSGNKTLYRRWIHRDKHRHDTREEQHPSIALSTTDTNQDRHVNERTSRNT
uniref:Major facilitator superfamily (MFS) profile domain-containing protein n=1 Tax=Kwoniella dejecticola CBS 10117 TaxID=1296121 RepID=A0A1A5ZXM7_9TREE|nr:uncharacterized protein I303_07322 [Kwoniella dejecticola CBS 10117]OBR82562.1 hypothetical protein I303_07322 [Kwoniella dejecticola CBS 10117]